MPVRPQPQLRTGATRSLDDASPAPEGRAPPTEEQLNDPTFRKNANRLDADVFRGLRDDMANDQVQAPQGVTIYEMGNHIVVFAILANSLQMGLAVQFQVGQLEMVWFVMEQLFTVIFFCEMIAKLYFLHFAYFSHAWNLLDFFLVWLAVVSNWIFPLLNVNAKLGVFMVLRMLRVLRIVRLLRVAQSLKVLVEGMFASMVSLGWILVLLMVNTYIFGIICCQTIDAELYKDMPDFDHTAFFGDLGSAMLTMFNVGILAEWQEIVRPVWSKQPFVVFLVFVPYLMLCTFGVLNLIIGVIAEQTMAAGQEQKDQVSALRLREKMKAIIRMADEMFEDGDNIQMTKHDFEVAAFKHPDFVDLMRQCDFPRGFEVRSLHLIFDESNEGTVDKEEFVNGMFRLVFNNLSQHACTILLGVSNVKQDIKCHVEEELDRLFAHVMQGNAGRGLPSGARGKAVREGPPSRIRPLSEQPAQGDVEDWDPLGVDAMAPSRISLVMPEYTGADDMDVQAGVLKHKEPEAPRERSWLESLAGSLHGVEPKAASQHGDLQQQQLQQILLKLNEAMESTTSHFSGLHEHLQKRPVARESSSVGGDAEPGDWRRAETTYSKELAGLRLELRQSQEDIKAELARVQLGQASFISPRGDSRESLGFAKTLAPLISEEMRNGGGLRRGTRRHDGVGVDDSPRSPQPGGVWQCGGRQCSPAPAPAIDRSLILDRSPRPLLT